MDWSIILNLLFGTGLVATVVGMLNIRNELKRLRAETEKAQAEADTVKITNTEQATRILIQNIVEPLRNELDATRKDLNATKREIRRFREAVKTIPLCPYHAGCPVLSELQNSEECTGGDEAPGVHGHTVRYQPGDDDKSGKPRGGKPGTDTAGKRRRKPARRGGIQPPGGEDQGVRPEEAG